MDRVAIIGERRRRGARARAGLTLLELMFALTLMLIGLLGFAQVLMITSTAAAAAREEAMASQAAAEMLKTIQSAGFAQIFGLYNDVTADDPGGPGTAPGKNFAIAGLNAAPATRTGCRARSSSRPWRRNRRRCARTWSTRASARRAI